MLFKFKKDQSCKNFPIWAKIVKIAKRRAKTEKNCIFRDLNCFLWKICWKILISIIFGVKMSRKIDLRTKPESIQLKGWKSKFYKQGGAENRKLPRLIQYTQFDQIMAPRLSMKYNTQQYQKSLLNELIRSRINNNPKLLTRR